MKIFDKSVIEINLRSIDQNRDKKLYQAIMNNIDEKMQTYGTQTKQIILVSLIS